MNNQEAQRGYTMRNRKAMKKATQLDFDNTGVVDEVPVDKGIDIPIDPVVDKSAPADGLTYDNSTSGNTGANDYFDATRERAAGLDAVNQIYGTAKWVQNFVQGPPPNVGFSRVALSRVRANKDPLYNQAKTIKETASGANEQLKRGLGQGSDFTAATVAVNQNTQAALEDNAIALQEVLAKENMANVEISNQESVANTELRNKEIAINFENRAKAAAQKRQALQQTEDFQLKSLRDKYNTLGKVDGAQAQFNIMETAQKEQLKLEAATLKSQIEPQIEQASQKMLYDDWSQKFQGRREAIASEYEALSDEEKATTTLDDYVNQKVDAELMQYKESTDVEEYRKRAREQNSVYTYLEKILNQ